MESARRHLPISSRHAFALAFDLAVRRDPGHSLVIPLLLRAPWALTLALLPGLDTREDPSPILIVGSVALLGDFITLLVIAAMLRLRARSVYNTPPGVRPMPASDCYSRGLARVPSLFLTEAVRNLVIGTAASFAVLPAALVHLRLATFFDNLSTNFLLLVVAVCLIIPTLFVGFRLAVATESVVLDGHGMAAAFQHSFRAMRGHFERWFELISFSAALVLGLALFTSLVGVLVPALTDEESLALFWVLVILVTPVIQYSWTFFYLRLLEVEQPIIEVGPAYADADPAPPGAA